MRFEDLLWPLWGKNEWFASELLEPVKKGIRNLNYQSNESIVFAREKSVLLGLTAIVVLVALVLVPGTCTYYHYL